MVLRSLPFDKNEARFREIADERQIHHNRAKKLLEFGQQQKASRTNWVDANNAIYGKNGKYAELFRSDSDRQAFSRTAEFKKLSELLASLTEPEPTQQTARTAATVSGQLRVRMPKSIHAALIEEAENEGVSLNQLIVSKLSVQLRACV